MGNNIGYTMEIALGAPATDDKAGAEALTPYTAVVGNSLVPSNRFTSSDIDVEDLASGIVIGEKGGATGVNQTIAVHTSKGTGGHAELIQYAAFDEGSQVTIRVTPPAPGANVEYFVGILRNYQPKERTIANDDGFTVDFRQNRPSFTATPPV